MVVLACGHGCCEEGWEQYIAANVRDGRTHLGCVGVECEVSLSDAQIRSLTHDPSVLERYEHFVAQRSLEADPSVRWCTNPSCGQPVHGYISLPSNVSLTETIKDLTIPALKCLISVFLAYAAAVISHRMDRSIKVTPETHQNVATLICFGAALFGTFRVFSVLRMWEVGVETRISRCDSCGTEQCFSCKKDVHAGQPCAAGSAEDCKEWLCDGSEALRAPCHGCRSIVELHDGCNHITCVRCGYQFCMLCGESIAGNVLHHYSKGLCTRYNGGMTESWKQRCWDFGNTPLKFTADQVNQLSIPCVVAIGAWLLITFRQEIALCTQLFCTPYTLVVTSSLLSCAIVSQKQTLTKQIAADSWQNNSFTSKRHQRQERHSELYLFVYPVMPQLSSLGIGALRLAISWADSFEGGGAGEGVVGRMMDCGEAVVRTGFVMWCAWAAVRLCVQPHIHLQRNWNNSLNPSFLRPFLDAHLVANLYTAAFHCVPGPCSKPFAILLSFAMVVLGAMAFFAQVPFTEANETAPRFRLAQFWVAYRRLVQYSLMAFIVVFFDATWSLRCVTYCVLCVLIFVTPTSLEKIPFDTALLGYLRRWQEGGKKGPLKKVSIIVALCVLVELAFLDASADGRYIALLTKCFVLNIAPLSILSLHQRWVSW